MFAIRTQDVKLTPASIAVQVAQFSLKRRGLFSSKIAACLRFSSEGEVTKVFGHELDN
jgi:hypothetical protein